MATRALITVKGTGIYVYKHWDGYPEGMMPWLEKFHSEFMTERGWDQMYMLAQLLRSSVTMADEFSLDPSTSTGWGVTTSTDCGQDYTYTLSETGVSYSTKRMSNR
jgi:hypothetical protein